MSSHSVTAFWTVNEYGEKVREYFLSCSAKPGQTFPLGAFPSMEICPLCGKQFGEGERRIEDFLTAENPAEACPHWIPTSGGPAAKEKRINFDLPSPVGQAVPPGDGVCPHHCD